MNRQTQASRAPWLSPPSTPSRDTVSAIEGAVAAVTGPSHGASSRPCAAPVACASPVTRNTATPPSHVNDASP